MTEKALAEQMIDDEQIDRNKLAAASGWLVAPSPTPTTAAEKVMDRARRRTPDETAALIKAGNRRYAHLANQRRDWIADLRKNRREKGITHNRGEENDE